MPVTGRWSEVTSRLPQFTVHMGAYTSFIFRGLIDFLILVEEQVNFLGDTPVERSNAASQLANMALIAPAMGQHLLFTIDERNQVGNHQMRLLFAKNPQAE